MKKLSKLLLYLSLPFLGLSVISCGNEPTLIPGSSGTPGVIGPQGPVGPTGEVGDKGEQGTPGTNGLDGSTPYIKDGNWWIGDTDTGIKATSTVPGDKGEQGTPGLDGADGIDGTNGKPGLDGEVGDKGPTGDTGSKGETGDKGPIGDKGETGVQGDKGPTGDKGEQGEPGLDGDQGPTGNKGETGDKDAPGETGLPGDKGDKGETGVQGDKGPTGEAGDKGAPGEDGKSPYQIYKDKYTYAGTEQEWVIDYLTNKLGTSKTYNAYYYNDVMVDVSSVYKNMIPDIKYELTGTLSESETKTLANGESLSELFNTHPSLNLLNNPGVKYDPSIERAHEDIHAFTNEGYEGFIALTPLQDLLDSRTDLNGYNAYAYYVSFENNQATRLTDEDIDKLNFTFLSGKEVTITHSNGRINFNALTNIYEDVYISAKDPINNPLKIMDSKMLMSINDVHNVIVHTESCVNPNEAFHIKYTYFSRATVNSVALTEEEASKVEIVDSPDLREEKYTFDGNTLTIAEPGVYKFYFKYGVEEFTYTFMVRDNGKYIESVDMSYIHKNVDFDTSEVYFSIDGSFSYKEISAVNFNDDLVGLYIESLGSYIKFVSSDETAYEVDWYNGNIILKKEGTFDFYIAEVTDEIETKVEGTDFVVHVSNSELFNPVMNFVNKEMGYDFFIALNPGKKNEEYHIEYSSPNQDSMTFNSSLFKTNVKYLIEVSLVYKLETCNANMTLTYKGEELPFVYDYHKRGLNGFEVIFTDTTSPLEFNLIEKYDDNEIYSTFNEAIDVYKISIPEYLKDVSFNIGGTSFNSNIPNTYDNKIIKQVVYKRNITSINSKYIEYHLIIEFNEGLNNTLSFLDYLDDLLEANYQKAICYIDYGFYNSTSHEFVRFAKGYDVLNSVEMEIRIVSDEYAKDNIKPYTDDYSEYTEISGFDEFKTQFDKEYQLNPFVSNEFTFAGKNEVPELNMELVNSLKVSKIYLDKFLVSTGEGVARYCTYFDIDDYSKFKESLVLIASKCDIYYNPSSIEIVLIDPKTNTYIQFIPAGSHSGKYEIGIISDQIIDLAFTLLQKAPNTSKGE